MSIGATLARHLGVRHKAHSPTKESEMSTTTHITGIRTVSIPVNDQDAALQFYVGTLGFDLLRDAPIPGGRWIELAPGSDTIIVTLEPAASGVTRGAIGIRFVSDDIQGTHEALSSRKVDVDEILRWPGVPAMFAFRDPDGNAFSVTSLSL
jgi:lactoylglutathione lyase